MQRGKDKTKKEFEELLLEVRRVTRVTTGGRRMSFRATVLVGNKKGKIGIGLSKGPDVTSAVKKAANEAYKNMFIVPITKAKTVPYMITNKYKACVVKLLPATQGTGLKAGSSVRSVLDLAGYENILSKIIGSNNKLNNALATIKALSKYKHADYFTSLEDKKESEDKEDKKVEKEAEGKKVEKKPAAKKKTTTTKKPATKKTTTTKKPTAKKTTKKEDK
ncbi:MAG TPA: 30S ribosomal protein S5 [Candidatus Absconditabacterales bacterium]|nr:30S ribosomal protein S5 [Candidatus Absconditabacterales bacterium]